MRIGNFDISRFKEVPPIEIKKPFELVTRRDSYMYDEYNPDHYNPNKLYEKKGSYELFDKMRVDDQITAILNLKKYIILSCDWNIESESEDAVEFIEDNFNTTLDETFIKKLYDILSAMDYGFSLTERVFKREGSQIRLDKLKTRAPHSFDFVQDKFGTIEKIIQYVTETELEIDPSKFIHYPYNQEFDNPYGKSLLNEGVYRAYWSKNAIIKFWNIYHERHGMPLGVGTYPNGSGGGSLEDFKKIGKNLQAKTFVTMPEGFELDFKEATRGTDSYEKAIDKYNMMVARAMLVPDLLGFGGSEISGGSYSLGEKQFEIFYSSIDFDRRQLERLITEKLVMPLVKYNFGDIPSKFVFTAVDDTKRMELLRLWLDAVNAGKIPVTDTHINWFLSNVEAPEIDKEELQEIKDEKEKMQEALKGDAKEDIEDKEDKKPEQKEADDEKAKPAKKEFVYQAYRELTSYEKKENFKQIDNDFNRLEEEYIGDLSSAYRLSINALVDEIKRKQIVEKKKFSVINNLTLKHQVKIEKLIRDLLKESMSTGYGSVQKNYIVDSPGVLNDDDIAEWLDQHAGYVTDVESDFILNKVKVSLSEGIRAGDSVRDIMATLDGVLRGYDINLDSNRIEQLVRTNLNAGYNEGRAQQFNEMSTEIQAMQYSAILDGRTSPICTELDKKVFKLTELSYYNPPNHFYCRSVLVPILNDEELILNPPPATQRDQTTGGSFLRLNG